MCSSPRRDGQAIPTTRPAQAGQDALQTMPAGGDQPAVESHRPMERMVLNLMVEIPRRVLHGRNGKVAATVHHVEPHPGIAGHDRRLPLADPAESERQSPLLRLEDPQALSVTWPAYCTTGRTEFPLTPVVYPVPGTAPGGFRRCKGDGRRGRTTPDTGRRWRGGSKCGGCCDGSPRRSSRVSVEWFRIEPGPVPCPAVQAFEVLPATGRPGWRGAVGTDSATRAYYDCPGLRSPRPALSSPVVQYAGWASAAGGA